MFAASKTSTASSGYQIQRSLRFNSADSAYLNRTPASDGNQLAWTISLWVKRSKNGAEEHFVDCTGFQFYFDASDVIGIIEGGTNLQTSQVFRDNSAWYHVVLVWDSANATSIDRVRLYINGSRVTAFSSATYPVQNRASNMNRALATYIGRYYGASSFFMDGYMTEINFIDGQALTASSFGQTDAQTGVWQPKAYSGSYGTNGFYLNFSDNSNTTAATLGKDYSGNGNNWTPNNFSVTAGVGNDSLVDVPTLYGIDTGVGGTVRGNYSTLNPLNAGNSAYLFNGNLDLVNASEGAWRTGVATIAMSSGKWYAEVTVTNNQLLIGIDKASVVFSGTTTFIGGSPTGWGVLYTGQVYNNSGVVYNNSSYAAGDIIGLAFDADSGVMTWYKNNVAMSQTITGLTSGPYVFGLSANSAGNASINFGQRPFAYTAPSGYKALCTQNLPTPTIGATTATQAGKYFAPILYSGDGTSSRSVTGVGFQPDFVWLKARNYAFVNGLWDSVRGGGKLLISNLTLAEITNDPNGYVSSFNSDGFTLTAGTTNNDTFNGSANQMVAWNWKANGSGSTNTAGSITSTVSANTTSGFSVVNWTQPASGTYTIGHGLGSAPAMILMKSRTATNNWAVYHQSIGYTQYGRLNTTDAFTADSSVWVAAPTSSVFSQIVNYGTGGTSIAYCFAPVSGYSAFGSWTGNGSADGPFVFTGFKPAYILWKRTDSSAGGDWGIVDATRNPSNVVGEYLAADTSGAGATYSMLDMVSNGFKIRWSDTSTNASGGTYIYMAFASAPFKFSLGR